MKKRFKFSAALIAALMTFSGCIDDDIDLENIDTTAEVKVVDLTVPLNLDEIKLSSVISLDEGSKIKEINGEYVFVSEGEFASDDIRFSSIELQAPSISSNYTQIDIPAEYQVGNNVLASQGGSININIGSVEAPFSTTVSDVSADIRGIDRVGMNFAVTVTFKVNGFDGVVSRYTYRNLKIALPKGMTCNVDKGTYDAATGIYTLDGCLVTNNLLSLRFEFTGIDMVKSKALFDAARHTFSIDDCITILSGEMQIAASDLVKTATLPQKVVLENGYTASDITINKFSGKIAYSPSGLSPEPFTLGDLPDVLSQPGTDISITNPQIYLWLSNPLYTYSLWANMNFDIMSRRNDSPWSVFTPDGGAIRIDGSRQQSCYCLSPTKPEAYAAGYEDAQHVAFGSLSDVLSGNGLPSEIAIDIDKSEVPEQSVTDLALGTNLGTMQGKYMLYAPLNLKSGSCIMYSDVFDGWNDEELDKVTITKIDITATIDNQCPATLNFTIKPIDVDGNKLDNVTVECSQVAAKAQGAAFTATVTGVVKHLDGIVLEAVARAEQGNTLSPSMNVKLSNIKVKVSGSYVTEL
ncbi:MAG: hypothetical protein ACI30V_06760 [Muribaculaceae bacterium]